MSTSARYAVGLDLGTTNCVLAAIDLQQNASYPEIATQNIFQRLSENETGYELKLPSFLFYPTRAQKEHLPLFDFEVDEWIIGEAAEVMGRRIQGRQVSSAKSWLCHHRVGGESGLLPWGGADDVPKISPLEATTRILTFLKKCWDASELGKSHPLSTQHLVVTLPASFDQRARQLTSKACEKAGLGQAKLLEEPQAAFYNWISLRKGRWGEALGDARRVLICDIGGGTSDFSLVKCEKKGDDFEFNREAVGRHLLLGGDNMDLAMAHYAEEKISSRSKGLNQSQWQMLAQLAKSAKESLLSSVPEDEVTLRLPGMGTKVIGGLKKATLKKDDVVSLILNGFYPEVDLNYQARKNQSGLTEMGLPYEVEPAITWHILEFLQKHDSLGENYPEAILFNGGSLEPQVIRQRICDVLKHNSQQQQGLKILESDSLAEAVARGAAFYAYTLHKGGLKIGGGSAQGYYLEIGGREQSKQVCVVPKGTEAHEGVEVQLAGLKVTTNQPVSFPLYQSDAFPLDEAGAIKNGESDLLKIGNLNAMVRFGKFDSRKIPVSIAGELTELDTLNLELKSDNTEHKWQLEFDLRSEDDTPEQIESDEQVVREFNDLEKHLSHSLIEQPERGLLKGLEKHYQFQRNELNIPELRCIADQLLNMIDMIKKSPQHESTWLSACSFALRPGLGEHADEVRRSKLWSYFRTGPYSGKDTRATHEWAILWRRVSLGLEPGRQNDIFQRCKKKLLDKKQLPEFKGAGAELWRMVASFEHLPCSEKIRLAKALTAKACQNEGKLQPLTLWALGRISSRQPLKAGPDYVIPADQVSKLVYELQKTEIESVSELASCMIEMCRKSGDRNLDVDEELQNSVKEYLLRHQPDIDPQKLLPLEKVQRRELFQQSQLVGESLPVGLSIDHS